ncbi:MAG: right-handed parallel beta-helix repeat-containing protein [Deltaproteobacteria bacterium]|nr:right-handed parallel beta-helix repeat-containing protein [Deltaproteobacteria bacterium]
MGQWSDATLLRGNTINRIKLRSRGDNSVHWMTEKKSFTLRTARSSMFKGHRRLAFSNKTVLPSYVANGLAGEFDLLAPFTTVSPVFVNERFYGIFRVSELVDESFLRNQRRMPGNIFRGDNAERGEVFKGLPRGLSVNPYIWDRVSKDHLPNSRANSMLQAFLFDAEGTTFDDHLRLMSWVDVDEIARLVALMLVVGDPIHLSDVNNNFWYQDPASGLMHPIPWDFRLLVLEILQSRSYRVSRLMGAFLRNPWILDRALHVIQEKIAGDRLLTAAERMVRTVYERYEEHFEYDRLREPFIPYVGIPDHVLSGLRRNVRLLSDWISSSVIAFNFETYPENGIIMDFEARGYAGSDLHDLVIEGDIRRGKSVRLMADRNRNGILDASDQEIDGHWMASESGGKFILAKPQALLPGVDTGRPGIKPAPIHYRFFLTFSNYGKSRIRVSKVHANLRNRLTGNSTDTIAWKTGETVSATPAWHPWQYPSSSPVVHRLKGNIRLRETLVISKGDTLVIDAGTTILMDRDVSILTHGRVVVRGTKKNPITFRPTVLGQPWGTFALQGEGASGSDFEHVRFLGGGGAVLGRIEYKGMISVHWAQLVSFRNCEFSDNVRSDDALNAVHANVTIENCTFLRTNSDAIDFDYSSGSIANCRFEASGNDAIDLMSSSPRIVENYITGSGDKGISIGEASHPFVFNNHIVRSNRGIEIKDGSEPFIVHNTITQNAIGILQSAKNWRYGSGGWGKLVNSLVMDNDVDTKSDKDSRLTNVNFGVDGKGPILVGTRAAPSPLTENEWIFAHFGIRPNSTSLGQIHGWNKVEPIAPKVFGTFQDNFEQMTNGWFGGGGVSRMEKRDHDLQVTFSRRPGHITRNVDWNLTDPKYTYIAVFELANRNVRSGEISLHSNTGKVTRPFEVVGGLSSYAFVSVKLTPENYTSIQISANPGTGTGLVHLHAYRLYAIPKAHLES